MQLTAAPYWASFAAKGKKGIKYTLKALWDNRWYVAILALATSVEVAVKLQNSANGAFATQDEPTNYMRGLYLLQHGHLPTFEPMQDPLSPIIAPFGAAVGMAFLMLVFQFNAANVSLAGAVIGGLVFPFLFFAGRALFATEENGNALALSAVALALLSPWLIIRMQLLLGETLAFVLFLIAIRFYTKGEFRVTGLLMLLIGFTEELTALIFILVMLLAGLVSGALLHEKNRLKWSLVLSLLGLVPEGVLFVSQGTGYRVSFVSGGLLPYPNILSNFQTMIGQLGILLPLMGFLGLALCLHDMVKNKVTVTRIVLVSWLVVAALYALYPPLLPGGSLVRLMDYVTLPLALLGAYSFGRLLSSLSYMILLDVSAVIFAVSIPSDTFFPGLTFTNFTAAFKVLLENLPTLTVTLIVTAVCWISFLLVFSKSLSKKRYRRTIIGLFLLVLLSSSFMEASSNAGFETHWYSGYFTSNDLSVLSSFSANIPHNSVIATPFSLAPMVALTTGRLVKDLPPDPSNASDVLNSIKNDSVYSEQFGPGGVVPPSLRVPLEAGVPIYLVLLVGGSSIVFANPGVIKDLSESSNFRLVVTDGRMYVFSVFLG